MPPTLAPLDQLLGRLADELVIVTQTAPLTLDNYARVAESIEVLRQVAAVAAADEPDDELPNYCAAHECQNVVPQGEQLCARHQLERAQALTRFPVCKRDPGRPGHGMCCAVIPTRYDGGADEWRDVTCSACLTWAPPGAFLEVRP